MLDLECEEQIDRDERESRSPSANEDHSEGRPVRSGCNPQGRSFLAPSKADLLAKACDREPKMFHRIDGWITEAPNDLCLESDLRISAAATYELMGGADVRVLIRPDLDRNARLRLLQQVLEHEREVAWEDREKNTARTGSRKKRHGGAPQAPSKGELLAQLCDRQPTKFHQIDAWTKDPFDGLLPSEFDDHIAATVTHELMSGPDLRVLIRPDLDRATRFELIQRVLEFERRFDWEEYEWDFFALEARKAAATPALDFRDLEGRKHRSLAAANGRQPTKIARKLLRQFSYLLADSGGQTRQSEWIAVGADGDDDNEAFVLREVVDGRRVHLWLEIDGADTKPTEGLQKDGDVKGRPGPCPDVDQETGSDQDRHHEGSERFERLTDRLARTTSFDGSRSEWLRVQALSEPRPDYGTFLKDQELIELFPEAADIYHVDDIRRALMMIRMVLEYGEGAFTRDDGDAVYLLLACILEQSDDILDGTWSANNPAARERDVRARTTPMPGLDFDDDDDFEDDEESLERPQRPQTPGNCEYRVPECFEDDSLTVRTCVPDAERRLGHLISMLESDEFRRYTSCSIQPEELQVVRNVGAWLLGIDPTYYTTERVLNALASVWALVRAHDRQVDRASGGAD